MKKETINLNFYQVMTYIHEIDCLKRENNNFKDDLVKEFEKNILEQISSNIVSYYNVPDFIVQNARIYKVTTSMYNYLTNLTGVDVCDEAIVKHYKKYIKTLVEFELEKSKLQIYRSANLGKKRVRTKSDNK